ncbi:MAG TPA: hypothetical protein VHD32_05075 [Candidatus Didemnitutus sp.]|nr:hypothetical protein [Candidatus Didemnitutus sp.]
MVAAIVVPFLVHLIPWSGTRPAGVYLLPVFWTAFVAVYSGTPLTALAVALAMPVANLVATGLPALDWVGPMSLELVAYVLVAALLVHRWPRFWLAAPIAYIPAKAIAIAIQWFTPIAHDGRDPFPHLLASTQNGLAGLLVLALINFTLLKLCGTGTTDWDDE